MMRLLVLVSRSSGTSMSSHFQGLGGVEMTCLAVTVTYFPQRDSSRTARIVSSRSENSRNQEVGFSVKPLWVQGFRVLL